MGDGAAPLQCPGRSVPAAGVPVVRPVRLGRCGGAAGGEGGVPLSGAGTSAGPPVRVIPAPDDPYG